ncbi:TIM barrel protein [Rothia uropygialis]|uniref:TIM barrel protein n=1 Tax=Kocuria sp. 36 TaxID=1415402 RepID=UPI001EE94728|nr:TIM barrel protein [Kocuria sp. 36]
MTKLATAPITWGVIEVPDWGVQLRPEQVLTEMRGLGFSATEFGPEGFLPDDPEGRSRVLKEHGLSAVGGFFPAVLHREDQDPLPQIRKELEAYAAAGADVMVLSANSGKAGYDTRPDLGDSEWETLLGNLNTINEVAAAVGVTTTLHPHMGTLVQTPEETERVLAGSTIGLCVDTGHYTLAGGDPLDLVRKHPDRVAHIHLKDVDLSVAQQVADGDCDYREGCRRGMYQALGKGDAKIAEIVKGLQDTGYQGWYVLEQDTVLDTEDDAAKAHEDARYSAQFIKELI